MPSAEPAAVPSKPDKVPTLTAAQPKSSAAPAGAQPAGKKPVPLNDKDGALLPKPAEPAPQTAALPAPPPPAPAPAPAPAAPVAAPAAPTIASPSERCSDKSGITRRLCVALVCGLPELHNHPECVAIRRN